MTAVTAVRNERPSFYSSMDTCSAKLLVNLQLLWSTAEVPSLSCGEVGLFSRRCPRWAPCL